MIAIYLIAIGVLLSVVIFWGRAVLRARKVDKGLTKEEK